MRLLSLLLILCLAPLAVSAEPQFRGFTPAKKILGISAIPFSDPYGRQVTINHWQGKWLLLNLWATWCAPCVAELPTLEQFATTQAFPNLAVAAVSLDVNKTSGEIGAFLKQRKIGPFAAYQDSTHAMETALRSIGLPMTYLVDPAGKIVATYRGSANWMDPAVIQDLNRWINAGTTSNTSPINP